MNVAAACTYNRYHAHHAERRIAHAALAMAIGAATGTLAPASALAAPNAANDDAQIVVFNSAFLMGGAGGSLQRFSRGNPVEPGIQSVDVTVNGLHLDRRDIAFVPGIDPLRAAPCLTTELLSLAGVKQQYLADTAEEDPETCIAMDARIPQARARFDPSTFRLDLSIPQAALNTDARGSIDPRLLDRGVSAAFIDYTINASRTRYTRDAFAGLNVGTNLGAWRLRHRASINRTDGQPRHYQAISTYAQRELVRWRSQLTLGEGNTTGEMFDSVGFTGMRVASDDRMLPDSLRGYAPVVRGIARTQATVSIRQNGYVIHETSVAPGAFEIADLHPTAYSGDLQVTVTEASGRQEVFTVSFSAVPQALREGIWRYSLTGGRLRSSEGIDDDGAFAEATWARGLNNRFTLLAGTQLSQAYRAGLAGLAINTALGAFGADLTLSSSRRSTGAHLGGSSLRLSYGRHFSSAGAHIGVAAYRYGTRGFTTLTDASRLSTPSRADAVDGEDALRARQKLQLDLSMNVGGRGALYARSGYVRYWGNSRSQTDVQIGYQSAFGVATYSLAATRTLDHRGTRNDGIQLTLALPLGGSSHAPRASAGMTFDRDGGSSRSLGLNGTFGENEQLSYGIAGSGSRQRRNEYNGTVHYQGSAGAVRAGLSHGQYGRTTAAGMSGALVFHAGGVNAMPGIGDGFALIHAEGATGAAIGSAYTMRIGRNGYGVQPSISPYRWNSITLDPSGLPLDVQLEQTSRRIAPSAGAVVRVSFAAHKASLLLLRVRDVHGRPLHFGSDIRDADGRIVGTIGQAGLVHARGLPDQGQVTARLPTGEACQIAYQAPSHADQTGLRWADATCTRSTMALEHEQSPDLNASP